MQASNRDAPVAEPIARLRRPVGSSIAVHDLGGTGEPLVMVHATGFHSMAFGELAHHLRGFRCLGMDLRAHGMSKAAPSWSGDWEDFSGDVLAVVDELGLGRPFGFGHSCGGATLLLAEEHRPRTFRHLFCFEPVVVPMMEPAAPSPANPMSAGALRRRAEFASRTEAYDNYASKPPLNLLSPTVLRAYVDYGFEDTDAGTVRLRCLPADEAKVFAHGAAHATFRRLAEVACPVDLACGGNDDTFGEGVLSQVAARLTGAEVPARVQVFPGLSHFGPLEAPDVVATAIIRAFVTPSA